MVSELSIPDQRMLALLEMLLASGEIRFRQEFLDAVGFHKQNFKEVEAGRRSFRVDNIVRACATYRIDANWILGLTDVVRPPDLTGRKSQPSGGQLKGQSKAVAESKSQTDGAS